MNWRNTGILVVVLVVPIALILIFKTGTTQLVDLPVYGEKSFINGDSVDYSVDLSSIVDVSELKGNHVLLYLSSDIENRMKGDAKQNLLNLAKRLESAKAHPTNPVKDVVILSVSNTSTPLDSFTVWHNLKPKRTIENFVSSELKNSFNFSETPINDHVSFLIDKDGRIRSMYYTAHGKFDRNILGELVVLQTEYGNKPITD